MPLTKNTRTGRVKLARLVALVGGVLAWAIGWTALARPQGAAETTATASPPPARAYWQYRDDDGVLHITNVDQSRGRVRVVGPGDLPRISARQRHDVGASADEGDVRERGAKRYAGEIRGAAELFALPPALVYAVMHTESRFFPQAVSSAGAMGLMQLMPATARWLGVRDPFDPRQNIYGGARFLRLLANRFGGDMVLVLAAYHAGAGAVRKYGGVPPYASTRAYVRAVLRRFYDYQRSASKGTANGTRNGTAAPSSREPAALRHVAP